MQPVATAAEMRALDEATIRDIGLPGAVLMETAGRAIAAAVRAALGDASFDSPRRGSLGMNRGVVVVCGGGNNGGDGFVTARVLRAGGVDAQVYLVAARDGIRGDARLHLDAYQRSGGRVVMANGGDDLYGLGQALAGARVIVDAVLGTGLARAVEGHLADVIARINAAPGVRIAADIPSGLSADTGHPLGIAVKADLTVTMAVPKLGLCTAPGFAWVGEVEVADIGIPRALVETGTRAALVEPGDVHAWLPSADRLEHKGRRGHLLVIAGSPGKRGAGRLATTAGLRAGAGLCTLAGPPDAGGAEVVAPDAVMTAVVSDAAAIAALTAGKDAVVIGPGMPDDDGARAWIDAVLGAGIPAVIDATGLAHLAGRVDVVARAAGPVVLTPHPGEAARLLGTTAAAVEDDRMAAVRDLAAQTRAVVVLKGARTLVCDGAAGDGFVTINPTGGPALATAGTGDVLAGTIGALLAQGLTAVTAARLGAWIHGAAGDALAARTGPRGVVASDLPDAIAHAMR